MNPIQPEVIRTDRLALLPLRVGHAGAMARVLADPLLYRFTGGSPLGVAALRHRYRRQLAGSPSPQITWCNWVVRLNSAECLVGTVQATIDHLAPQPTAEVAWVVGTAWQRRGIATEAALALVGWLRRHGVATIVAHIHPDHTASATVASAAGLVPTSHWQDGEIRWELHQEVRWSGGCTTS